MYFQLKKYKYELQKAVNIPVNTIAPKSGSHLREKLQHLRSLLSGQQVDVDGKRVSAADPASIAFVKDLFAKKIVVSHRFCFLLLLFLFV